MSYASLSRATHGQSDAALMGVVRIILVLAVVIGHIGPFFGYAPIEPAAAVQCFYVLSGFYMALVLERAYSGDAAGVRRFYVSRYVRLAPTYWVILFATLAGAIATHRTFYLPWQDFLRLLQVLTTPSRIVLGLTNLLLLGQDAVMFLAINPVTGRLYWTAHFAAEARPAYQLLLVPQAWCLGLVLLFYLVAPFLLRRPTSVLWAVFVLSAALRAVLIATGLTEDPWTYRFFPSEVGVFVAGALAYRAYDRGRGAPSAPGQLAIFAGVLALLLLYAFIPFPDAVKRLGTVAVFAACLPSIFALTRASRWDTFIGRLSYPMYLSHLMLLGVARLAGAWSRPVLLLLTILVSAALVRFVEDPVDRWRARLKSARRSPPQKKTAGPESPPNQP
jgi:peptidoglycan/LPS O-acetylase OafA/YrhL